MNEKKKSHPPWRPKAMGKRRPVAKGSPARDSATFEVLPSRSPGSPTCRCRRRRRHPCAMPDGTPRVRADVPHFSNLPFFIFQI